MSDQAPEITENEAHCGYVAIVGRPNVGKSTLLNRALGIKLSIVSEKPQTTRHRIAGIKSTEQGQIIYVDTPGIHLGGKQAINRYMNRVALAVLRDVDIVLFVTEALRWSPEDENVLKQLKRNAGMVLCAVNKVDKVPDKAVLLPWLEELAERYPFAEIVPISAKRGTGVASLEAELVGRLPFSRPHYDEDQITDRSERFLAAEFVREQLTRRMHQELPYALTVEIEEFERSESLLRISAIIWVERAGQKKIVIGKDGSSLKAVGKSARIQMEQLFGCKVYVRLWVKVKSGWSDDERALGRLGYD